MKRTALLPILLLSLTSFAAGDSVPVFDLTQGSVTVTPNLTYFGVDQVWAFSNDDVTINGINHWGPTLCLSGAPAGTSCDPSFYIANLGLPEPNMGTVGGSSTLVFFGGPGVQVSSASFILPSNSGSGSFSVTVPVLFSGSFDACVAGGQGLIAGCYNQYTGVTNPVFAIFNVNGTGVATLNFVNVGWEDDTVWRLSSGTYTLNPVPEPGSIVLLGTGAVGLILRLRRKIYGAKREG